METLRNNTQPRADVVFSPSTNVTADIGQMSTTTTTTTTQQRSCLDLKTTRFGRALAHVRVRCTLVPFCMAWSFYMRRRRGLRRRLLAVRVAVATMLAGCCSSLLHCRVCSMLRSAACTPPTEIALHAAISVLARRYIQTNIHTHTATVAVGGRIRCVV